MSEKRFTLTDWHEVKDNGKIMTVDEVVGKLNEQQATINHLKQELEEYKENWDDMVELATKTSLRNVELDEQIGRLQRENEQLKKARDKSDKFIVKKGLEIEFLEWCVK